MNRPWPILVALLVIAAAPAPPVIAHDRGTSYSTWTIGDDAAHVSVRLTDLDLTRYPWGAGGSGSVRAEALRRYLPERLVLQRDGQACRVSDGPRSLRSAPGFVTWEWQLRCPAQGGYELRSTILADVSPEHLHFARVRMNDDLADEKVLSSRGNVWDLGGGDAASEPGGTSLAGYFVLGVEHIITGYDHLAFVLALLLLGGSVLEIAKIVTGFTVAHSLTLALMVLGYVRPAVAPIEALIGLSIALVAAENLWHRNGRGRALPAAAAITLVALAIGALLGFGSVPALTLGGLALFTWCYFGLFGIVDRAATMRWSIAFLFGLIHGFGFAAMLTEAGLPTDRVAAALLGFNLGVEAGQLAVVAAAWPLLVWLRRRGPTWHTVVAEGGSTAVLALGMYWFVIRTYG